MCCQHLLNGKHPLCIISSIWSNTLMLILDALTKEDYFLCDYTSNKDGVIN